MFRRPRKKKREHLKKPDRDLTKEESVFEQLRDIQWQTNCSSGTLSVFLTALRGKLGRLVREIDDLPGTVKYADKKMQRMVCLIFHIIFLYNII